MDAFMLVQADADFYSPLSATTTRGTDYRPSSVPQGWVERPGGPWLQWLPPHGLAGVEEGWKVHVSCRLERAQAVLDAVAAVAFAGGTPFKHLACSQYVVITNHKHASRAQSGKFIALYPPDAGAARALMSALADALDGEEGPYVLSDRRFGCSTTVHYRYGAYVERSRTLPDGRLELLVRDGNGVPVPDRREPRFALPDGVVDPFAEPATPGPRRGSLGGTVFRRAIRHSNAGGTYEGVQESTGRTVFVKEGRAHAGLDGTGDDATARVRREYAVLSDLHEREPGLAPEPVHFFTEWEHQFAVSEFVPGIPLSTWWARNNPIVWSLPTPDDLRAYHDRCLRIVDALARDLDRLHRAGYAFVDLNPGNVLVDGDRPRLIDFEMAVALPGPARRLGAPGYLAPPDVVGDDPRDYDDYGLSALASAMIAPLNVAADRHSGVLEHLRREIERRGRLPERLWSRATRFRTRPAPGPIPTPDEVEADLSGSLYRLRAGLREGLLATADADHPDRVFPLGPRAYATNKLGLVHGLAGIVQALGGDAPPAAVERLCRETTEHLDTLPPGLHAGLAGIAGVLAGFGHGEEARDLLDRAVRRVVDLSDPGLGNGTAGVVLALLASHARGDDPDALDRAVALAELLPDPADMASALGPAQPCGLVAGRAGPALALHHLAEATGDDRHRAIGLRYLLDELARGVPDGGGLLFPVSATDARLMPYLYAGSAGIGMVASRYLADTGDPDVAAAMPGLIAAAGCAFTAGGGRYAGTAGLGSFLLDHAVRHDDDEARAAADRAACRLFCHVVPHGGGLHVLGEQGLRLSTDLWAGSAGVLVLLDQLLDGRPDPLVPAQLIPDGTGTTLPC